jgi:hypothetical protein
MARLAARKGTKEPITSPQEQPRPATPVTGAPGALWGYCPKCSAPGEYRDKPNASGAWGKDRCQNGHTYASMDAMLRPLVAAHVPANPRPRRRGRK